MKKITTLLASLLVAAATFAQVPQGFSYQAVVRDAQNAIVANQQVDVTISILQGATAESATAVFSETHSALTNANGLFTLTIGSVETAKFAAIDWTAGPAFLKTESAYGTAVTQLLSVPFALYAAKAGSAEVDLSNYATKEELPTDYVSSSALNTAISGVEAKIPAATDLSEYYKKADVDALLAELNAKVTKLDKQLNPPIPGVIEFAFSVSADKQIYFSQGNLQYHASTGTWRFAENQWDYVGTQTSDENGYFGGTVNGSDNANISENYDGWIDLFGWGTSGYNDKFPYMTSTTNNDYGDGANDIAGTNYDWGVNNAISNGGNQAGMWRTLTKEEWIYLIKTRADASSKRGVATVNSVTGLVLLPDDWALPAGVTFASGGSNFSQNTYFAEDWAKMEANGAVFFPAAGYREGTDVNQVGSNGHYWSSSADNYPSVRCFSFDGVNVYTGSGFYRYSGRSVRLVRGVEE